MRPTTASPLPYDAPEAAFGAQAAAWLDALRSGDRKAIELFKWEHPDYLERSVAEVEQAASSGIFTSDDARLVVARSYGFVDWGDLSDFLARAEADPTVGRFEEAVEAVVDGRAERLLALLTAEPALVRARSLRRHGATLLHYLGANGVEGVRQRTPPNAVRIAELLLDAGAEVDATADFYGAPCTTLTLVITSAPPAAAGVQADLAGVLIDRGATASGPDGSALSSVRMALASGYLDTARVLAERGAAEHDFVTSAGLGYATNVARLLPVTTARERHVALALAAQHGHIDVLRTLLDADEDPNRLNPPGHHAHTTPLHQAVYAGHLDVVELLVERGARLDIADTIYGGTAVGWARHAGHAEIEAFLELHPPARMSGASPESHPVSEATLVRAESPAHFFERCGPFLQETEAEHNLILGLATALLTGDHDYAAPIYLGWAEREGQVVGVVFRTPPYKVSVGAIPSEVIPDLVADLAATYSRIPAVMGPPETARAVATMWAERKGAGLRAGPRLRIHALSEVQDGLPVVPGHLRLADLDEQPLVRDWLRAFEDETGIPGLDPDAAATRMINEKQLYVWDHGGPTCMTAALGATPTAMRVGYVYTPPARRGSGYATAAVATLSALVLATGRRSLFLYTDLANPVSNRIYARIGYEPVVDISDFEIVER